MSVIRVAKRVRYTSVSREAVNDERLSFRARGLLIWLLDKPDDWRIDAEAISRSTLEGRDAIRTALVELEEAHYLVRTKTRQEGRFATESVLYESPALENRCGSADAVFQAPIRRLRQKTETEEKPSPPDGGATGPKPRPDTSTAAPKATANPMKAAAHRLAILAFEQERKPVVAVRGKGSEFAAVMAIIEQVLRGKRGEDEIRAVIAAGVEVWTVAGLLTAIAQHRTAARAGPRAKSAADRLAEEIAERYARGER